MSSAKDSADTDGRSATIDETQELSSSEQRRLAGLPDPADTATDLLGKEYLYTQTAPDERDIANSAVFRTAFVLLLVGTVVLAVFLMFTGFGGSDKKKSSQSVEPETKAEVATESDQYRAQLALVEQDDDRQQAQAEQTDQTKSAQLEQAPSTASQQSTQPDRQERSPRTQRAESPSPRRTRTVQQAAPATPRRSAQSEPQITPTIDPQQRWQLLAAVGTQRSDSANASSSATNSPTVTEKPAVSQSQQTQQQTPLQPVGLTNAQASSSTTGRIGRVTIGAYEQAATATARVLQPPTTSTTNSNLSPSPSSSNIESQNNALMSAGARGIVSRQVVQPTIGQATPATKQIVPLGSSAKAEVSVPIIWAEDGSSPTAGRFAVTLTEPLLAVNGKDIALPKGSVLITEVQEITPESHVVYQSAVAVVYRDRSGGLQQQEIAPHNLIVRGRNNQHLIAKSQGGSSGGSLKQDLLVGAMSGLGNIGEIINRPTEEIVREDDSFDSYRRSRRTTSGEADILGAALEGFFEQTAERVSERSAQALEQQAARKDVLLVPAGEQVTVYVNAFLEVQR